MAPSNNGSTLLGCERTKSKAPSVFAKMNVCGQFQIMRRTEISFVDNSQMIHNKERQELRTLYFLWLVTQTFLQRLRDEDCVTSQKEHLRTRLHTLWKLNKYELDPLY